MLPEWKLCVLLVFFCGFLPDFLPHILYDEATWSGAWKIIDLIVNRLFFHTLKTGLLVNWLPSILALVCMCKLTMQCAMTFYIPVPGWAIGTVEERPGDLLFAKRILWSRLSITSDMVPRELAQDFGMTGRIYTYITYICKLSRTQKKNVGLLILFCLSEIFCFSQAVV